MPKQQHMKLNCPEGTTVLQKLEFLCNSPFFLQTDDGYKKNMKIKCAPIKNYYLVYHSFPVGKKGSAK